MTSIRIISYNAEKEKKLVKQFSNDYGRDKVNKKKLNK